MDMELQERASAAVHVDPWRPAEHPLPSPEALRLAYRIGARSRALDEQIVRLVSRGDVKFAIWGPGEEVHGVATALALHEVVDPDHFGLVPHYRSGALATMWCALRGLDDLTLQVLRQQFSRATDAMSGGRQMVYHLHVPEAGILPVQSPVGMQLGKAAGYARALQLEGATDAVVVAVIGDGTTAEGDLHDAMTAASVWQLPLLVLVTDNGIAISTTPESGRGIRDFGSYARAFGVRPYAVDGGDFWDVYRTTRAAASWVAERQRPALLHVHSLPRFNGHSSAADVTYDLSLDDPLIALGQALVHRGLLDPEDVLRRKPGRGRDFFAHHDLGRIMSEEDAEVRRLIDQVRAEPLPDPARVVEFVRPPFPDLIETPPGPGTTSVSYAGAIRSAIDKLIQRHGGVVQGQDVARLGGVMQATAGLWERYPERVVDAPLNEPLIVGTAAGLALREGFLALPEIQFGDYALNAFHWLVHLGNLHWSTMGRATTPLVLRMPVDPFGGGALYHSMSVDGYFTPIPGLVIAMPSTSFDAHGLLLTAGQYSGPVVMLEPKWMYRQTLGPAFPDESGDPAVIRDLKKRIMRGEIPELPDVTVPFGKGAVRRSGTDLTVVAWGRAVWTAMEAAEQLDAAGPVEEGRVDEAAVEGGFTGALVVGHVNIGGPKDGIARACAHATNSEPCGNGRVAEDAVTFEASLGVETVYTEEGSVALQGGPAAESRGILKGIEGAVSEAVVLVEGRCKHPHAFLADVDEGHAPTGDVVLVDDLVSKSRTLSGQDVPGHLGAVGATCQGYGYSGQRDRAEK